MSFSVSFLAVQPATAGPFPQEFSPLLFWFSQSGPGEPSSEGPPEGTWWTQRTPCWPPPGVGWWSVGGTCPVGYSHRPQYPQSGWHAVQRPEICITCNNKIYNPYKTWMFHFPRNCILGENFFLSIFDFSNLWWFYFFPSNLDMNKGLFSRAGSCKHSLKFLLKG